MYDQQKNNIIHNHQQPTNKSHSAAVRTEMLASGSPKLVQDHGKAWQARNSPRRHAHTSIEVQSAQVR
jgi:hypothetical protein